MSPDVSNWTYYRVEPAQCASHTRPKRASGFPAWGGIAGEGRWHSTTALPLKVARLADYRLQLTVQHFIIPHRGISCKAGTHFISNTWYWTKKHTLAFPATNTQHSRAANMARSLQFEAGSHFPLPAVLIVLIACFNFIYKGWKARAYVRRLWR
jgi:hypothetical protein